VGTLGCYHFRLLRCLATRLRHKHDRRHDRRCRPYQPGDGAKRQEGSQDGEKRAEKKEGEKRRGTKDGESLGLIRRTLRHVVTSHGLIRRGAGSNEIPAVPGVAAVASVDQSRPMQKQRRR
jgi:hypothetical protein